MTLDAPDQAGLSRGACWRVRAGWLSGCSSLSSNALSPAQRGLVEALPLPSDAKLWSNFPYDLEDAGSPSTFTPTPLALASLVNGVRFLAASQPLVRPSRLQAWRRLKASCDRLLLVTGSCGSQIVAQLERRAPEGAELEVLSVGGVDWRGLGAKQTRMSGERDHIARLIGGPADIVLAGEAHLNLCSLPRVRDIAAEWVARRIRA